MALYKYFSFPFIFFFSRVFYFIARELYVIHQIDAAFLIFNNMHLETLYPFHSSSVTLVLAK